MGVKKEVVKKAKNAVENIEKIGKEQTLSISSPDFKNMERIPDKHTCEGLNVNPTLGIHGLPLETKSMVLIVEDPDAPLGTWDHWVVYNITPTPRIGEDTVPGVQGLNSAGEKKWHGPCPPSGTHRYLFKVFALNTMLELKENANKKEVEKAMRGHVLAWGELVGVYSK